MRQHPEIALGIPPLVVTAKPAAKAKFAAALGYDGPLTLAAAVRAGLLTRENAITAVQAWEEAGGPHEKAEELLHWTGS